MDELYTESFFKAPSERVELEKEAVVMTNQEPLEAPTVEIYATAHQFQYHQTELEKTLLEEYKNFADFQFILKKLRKKMDQKSWDGVCDLLVDLEQLMDLA